MPTATESRSTRLARNAVYGVLSWLLPLGLTLLVTPSIIRGLGAELYGLYAIILGFISYSFTFGIGKIAAKYVAEYRAAGRDELLSQVVSSVLWLSLGLGFLAIVFVALTARWLAIEVLLIPQPLQDTAAVALYLAAATIAVTMVSQVFQSVLQGLQRFDRYVWLTNLNAALLNLGSFALVISGYGIIALLVWNVSVIALLGLLYYITVRSSIPGLRLQLKIDREHWSASFRYGLNIVAYQVLGNALLLFERGWIVRRFGPEALTYYVVPMMLGLYFHAFISSFVLVIFPSMNELLPEREKLVALYQLATKVVFAMTVFFLVTCIVVGRPFFTAWLGAGFAEASYQILVFHTITFAVLSITVLAWQVTETFKATVLNVIANAGWVAIAIPLMIILSDSMQAAGVALGRLIGIVAYLPLIVVAERRYLGGGQQRFWSSLAIRLIFAGTLAALTEWLITSFLTGWVGVWTAVIAGALISGGALYLSGLLTPVESGSLLGFIPRRRRA